MDILSGAVITLALTVLGMVWRASGLVHNLAQLTKELHSVNEMFWSFLAYRIGGAAG